MSEEIALAAADLEMVRLLRAQNRVLSLQIGGLNTTIGYQDAMLTELRAALECLLAGPTDAAQDRARAALRMTEASASDA